ncbi:DUF742 domain-containing protein [Sciscionella marina]|uniref:DUF742 domain-containing protein n=1 Tax=Sciscionella marina TaxID=508770 RepID=UPI000A026BCE|nr:DUF742 domain-containing protein [Sciscionella marina]
MSDTDRETQAEAEGPPVSGTSGTPPEPRAGSDALFRSPAATAERALEESEDPEESVSLVRPYAWTQGRTESKVPLELETMVSTAARYGSAKSMGLEHQSIAELCRHPHSVAEVAAKLSVPLGVARVLLSDMAELGLIKVHQTVADDDMAAHLVLMERVLRGLRRL